LKRVLGGGEGLNGREGGGPPGRNPNPGAGLPRLLAGVEDGVVYGVVTGVCLDHGVGALLGRGPRLHVVRDAIAALDEARGLECQERWRAAGVELVTTEAIERALG